VASLPTVGNDFNQWGTDLNNFLLVAHNPDGTLQAAAAIPGVIITQGGLVYGGPAGVPAQLALGPNGYVLTSQNGLPIWAPSPAGFFNPMKHSGDLIIGGASGIPNVLGIGAANQVLTSIAGLPAWANSAAGFADPTTTNGDLIARIGGITTRLAIGGPNTVLTSIAGIPTWSSNTILVYPSGDNSGVTNTDGISIANAISTGQRVLLAPGTFYVGVTGSTAAGINIPGATNAGAPGGYLMGSGSGNTKIFYMGNGTGIISHGTQAGGASYQGIGATIAHLEIDGTNCAPTATVIGVDVGDQYDIMLYRVTVSNFTSSGTTGGTGTNPLGAVGIGIHNTTNLTEKCYVIDCTINNCGTPNTGGGATPLTGGGAAIQMYTAPGAVNTSRMYSVFDVHINQQPGQNGLVIARQGHLMNGVYRMRGNMNCPNVNNGSAAIVMGTGAVSDQTGHIQRMNLDIHVESDGGVGGNSLPFTIYVGPNADHTINKCFGRLQFLDGYQDTNMPVATDGTFEFEGPIIGNTTTNLVTPPTETYTSGTTVTYNGVPMMLYAQASGGSISAVNYNGIALPSSAFNGPFYLKAGMTIKFTYTGALTTAQIGVGMGY
jgi:hypothetical protein